MDKFPIQQGLNDLKTALRNSEIIDKKIEILNSISLKIAQMKPEQNEITIFADGVFKSFPFLLRKEFLMEAVEKQMALEQKKYHQIKDEIKNKFKDFITTI